MKILVIGNYYRDGSSYSMENYADLVERAALAGGYEVRRIQADTRLGKIAPSSTAFGKWLAYIDRFVLFGALAPSIAWADLVHITDHANAVYAHRVKGKPIVITCHDMIAVKCALGEFAERGTSWTGRIFQQWILSGLRRASIVVCVSETTRRDFVRIAGLPPDQVTVVLDPVNQPFRPLSPGEANGLLHQIGLEKANPFLVHVGKNSWYKNQSGAIEIFERLGRHAKFSGIKLVMVGDIGAKLKSDIARRGLAGKVILVEQITPAQLCAIYSTAKGLLFPSLYEGFGWPIIEAQACGCPVFTTNRPPMTEIGGAGAVYFDPNDLFGAAHAIAEAMRRPAALIKKGFDNVGRFDLSAFEASYRGIYRAFEKQWAAQRNQKN